MNHHRLPDSFSNETAGNSLDIIMCSIIKTAMDKGTQSEARANGRRDGRRRRLYSFSLINGIIREWNLSKVISGKLGICSAKIRSLVRFNFLPSFCSLSSSYFSFSIARFFPHFSLLFYFTHPRPFLSSPHPPLVTPPLSPLYSLPYLGRESTTTPIQYRCQIFRATARHNNSVEQVILAR